MDYDLPGATGPAGADGKTILNGLAAPSAGVGTDGDFFLDTTHSRLYGPKTSGAWGSGFSLIGATGATGPTGPMGPTGPTGAAGADGKTVLNGSGAPSSGTGANGDFYVDTTNGRFYGPKASGSWPGTYIQLANTARVYATADQSVTSSTSLTNSTYLTLSIPNGETWAIDGLVFVDTGANGDFRWDINTSATPTSFRMFRRSVGNGNTALANIIVDNAINGLSQPVGSGTNGVASFDIIVDNQTGSALTLTFRFCQNTSDGTPTTIKKGSYLQYQKVA